MDLQRFKNYILDQHHAYDKREITIEDHDSQIIFHYYNQTGIVDFWFDLNICEQRVYDENNNIVFYLHYEYIDFEQAFNLFTDFITQLLEHKEKDKKIVVCCSSGVTSSSFALKLQDLANYLHLPYRFYSKPIYLLREEMKNYDLVLLAPQIQYLYDVVVKYENVKTICIRTRTYATNNLLAAINEVQNAFN